MQSTGPGITDLKLVAENLSGIYEPIKLQDTVVR
jgi:hypothetical protein